MVWKAGPVSVLSPSVVTVVRIMPSIFEAFTGHLLQKSS